MPNKTQKINADSQTVQPKNNSEQDLPKTSGSIADDGVKTEALKPGSKAAACDAGITSANPAFSSGDS